MNWIRHPSRTCMRGVALIAVLWMVASLALLGVGLSVAARGEVRGAQTMQELALAVAAADAGIQLAVLGMRSDGGDHGAVLAHKVYQHAGKELQLDVIPVSGLININFSSEALLRDLFMFSADLGEAEAESLAQRVVAWRSAGQLDGDPDYEESGGGIMPRGGQFEYPEDLLQVLGLPFDVYDKVRGLVTSFGSNPGVSPLAAPVEVLTVLAGGDRDLAERIALARDAGEPVIDLTQLRQEHLGGEISGMYRIGVLVTIGDRRYVRTKWVDIDKGGADGSPWRVLRVETVHGYAGQAG